MTVLLILEIQDRLVLVAEKSMKVDITNIVESLD